MKIIQKKNEFSQKQTILFIKNSKENFFCFSIYIHNALVHIFQMNFRWISLKLSYFTKHKYRKKNKIKIITYN